MLYIIYVLPHIYIYICYAVVAVAVEGVVVARGAYQW